MAIINVTPKKEILELTDKFQGNDGEKYDTSLANLKSLFNNSLISAGSTDNIVADPSGLQGFNVLGAVINEVSTVASNAHSVTLPIAISGTQITVINNGMSKLKIWPQIGEYLNNSLQGIQFNSSTVTRFTCYKNNYWAVD